MLSVRGLTGGYGRVQVLFDISIDVSEGEVVTLLGRNGMGKTTTVRTLFGILPPTGGEIMFRGVCVHNLPSHKIARLGLGLVPEGRQVFPTLTVQENLVATASRGRDHRHTWTIGRIHELFPSLAARATTKAGLLSGGEQQMLAIGRALMTNPALIVLDEATEGLAPLVRQEIWRVLEHLKDEGLSILIIDKNIQALIDIATRHYVVEKGRVVWTGDKAAMKHQKQLVRSYLSV